MQIPRWLRPRFGLKLVLALVTGVCVWLGVHSHRAIQQQRAATAIIAAYGTVIYDYQLQGDTYTTEASPLPNWLVRMAGADYFHNVAVVRFVWDDDVGSTLDRVTSFPGLKRLSSDAQQLNNEEIQCLSSLGGLESLSLESNPLLTDEAVEVFRHLPHLHSLALDGTSISDRAVASLASLPRLTFIGLSQTLVTPEKIEWLRVANPRLTVRYQPRTHEKQEAPRLLAIEIRDGVVCVTPGDWRNPPVHDRQLTAIEKEAIAILAGTVLDRQKSDEARVQAAQALSLIGHQACVSALTFVAGDRTDSMYVRHAALCMAYIPDPRVVEFLIGSLQEPRLADVAETQLMSMTGVDFGARDSSLPARQKVQRAWRKWWSEHKHEVQLMPATGSEAVGAVSPERWRPPHGRRGPTKRR